MASHVIDNIITVRGVLGGGGYIPFHKTHQKRSRGPSGIRVQRPPTSAFMMAKEDTQSELHLSITAIIVLTVYINLSNKLSFKAYIVTRQYTARFNCT
jgi:hypothetical protein